ncbi:MAG: Holliday junction branch migration DNA helicase RuvB [Patescibacteria group bacterium]|jgi:Holliday junction DNA helicase RuvB
MKKDPDVLGSTDKEEEELLTVKLRPQRMDEYVGQEGIKENLRIFVEAAKQRNEPLDHVLLHGAPGLGKTTLAHIIAGERGSALRITSGPALERAGDLAAILSNLEEGDVLFIDEIHRLSKTVEEVLYPAMEEYQIDMVVGKGPSARTIRMDLPKFTIIGATTRVHLLSSPLRDRFGTTFRLDYYSDEEIAKIISRSASILGIKVFENAEASIARRSRRTPRVANRLLKRVRDFAEVEGEGTITPGITEIALNNLRIDSLGLEHADREILLTIIEKFRGGPVGLSTLAASTAEDLDTISDIYEPFLMQVGLLQRTPRGRIATPAAYKHLEIPLPADYTLFST